MALLDQLLVRNKARNTSRIGNGQRPLLVVTLVLFFVSIVLATVSAEFKFYMSHPNGPRTKVLFGKSLHINCTTNDPTASTSLYHQGIGSGDWYLLSSDNVRRVGDVYTIINFGLNEAGWFQCRATNKNQVTITWIDPSTEVNPTESHHPEATISTSYKVLDVGDSFNLTCSSRNDNDVKWFKITQKNIYAPVSSNRIITRTTSDTDIVTLIFKKAKLNDSGKFVCVATYEDTNDTKIATIAVFEPKPPILTGNSGKTVTVRSPSKIKIHCTFKGYPLPKIKWYKRNKEIQVCVLTYLQPCRNSRRMAKTKKTAKYVHGVLTIFRTNYQDAGSYICKAVNRKGNANTTISVKIETGARILVDQKDQTIIKELGKTLNMTCKADGHPLPNVSWIRTDNHKVLKHGNGAAILTLKSVTKKDFGNYTCKATNFMSDIKFFTISELQSRDKARPIPHKGITTENLIVIIVVCVCVILFMFIVVAIVLYRRQKMVTDQYNLGLEEITNYQFDPDRTLLEQCRNLPYDFDWEFPEDRLILGETLGSGAFGLVVKAEAIGIQALNPRDKSSEASHLRAKLHRTSVIKRRRKRQRCNSVTTAKLVVAVKTLKDGANRNDYTDLASELKILIHIGEHKNIINILGACTHGTRLMVIIEFAPHGDLLSFLRGKRDIYEPNWVKTYNNPDQDFTLVDLGMAAYQISRGMKFLASKKCIHRDLAARNVLVGHDYVMKISDFGLARDIYQDDQYVKTGKGLLPIKWMALESLFDRVYTHMSDVWSFGIVLWEIFTLGGTPYPSVPIEQLMEFLAQGQRMLQPNFCPDEIYVLMRHCWSQSPNDRPTFVEISRRLGQIFEDNIAEDTLGYLLLDEETLHYNNDLRSELEPVDSSLACGQATQDDTTSKPIVQVPSKTPPLLPTANNNNEYISGMLKRTNPTEEKPLLNHESSV